MSIPIRRRARKARNAAERPDETPSDEQIASTFWVDPLTAKLLGRAVVKWRSEHMVSREGMVKGRVRTEEWLAAVERGEIELTRSIVGDLEVMARGLGHPFDFHGLLLEIERRPVGDRARELTERSGELSTIASVHSVDTPASLQEAITPTMRFLVVAPILVVLALSTLAVRMFAWAAGTADSAGAWPADLVQLLDGILFPAVLVGGVVAYLSAEQMDLRFRSAVHRRRSSSAVADHDLLMPLIEVDGLPWTTDDGWDVERLLPHMIPRHRMAATRSSLRAQFIQRVQLILFSSFVVAAVCAVGSLLVNGIELRDVGPLAVVVGVIGLRELGRREVDVAGDDCFAHICRGLGWNLKSPR